MNNRSDRERLLADLFSDATPAGFRDASLERALAQARRARSHRRLALTLTALAALAASLPFLFKAHPPVSAPTLAATAKAPLAAAKVRIISDDELLNLFPGRAVALVGPSNHRKLVFLDASQ
jgi:hypothetical protein